MYVRYKIEKKQVSNDNGITWIDVYPSETRNGASAGTYNTLSECENAEANPYASQYLTIESLEDGNEIKYRSNGYSNFGSNISASTDNGMTWTEYASSTIREITIATLNNGEKVLLKGDNEGYTYKDETSLAYSSYFKIEKPYNVYGNIMSLISGDSFYNASTISSPYTFDYFFINTKVVSAENLILPSNTTLWCYSHMFQGCTSLVKTPQLPATTLGMFCYDYMFSNCTSLTEAPELPATTMSYMCYRAMFEGCTSLRIAPELPATTLAYGCYLNMLGGCTSLTEAPELIATTLADACYGSMFQGCTSLTTAPQLPATTLANACYEYMFRGCTSLTAAPQLQATTLAESCYQWMFQGCTSLTTAPTLPATTLATNCYGAMFFNCTSLIVAPILPALNTVGECYNYMFYGCTALTTVPEISATYINGRASSSSYSGIACRSMFEGCSSLNYIKCMATGIGFAGTLDWVKGVSSSGIFVKASSMNNWTNDINGIPEGWTVQNA